jgi:hypothetical protein
LEAALSPLTTNPLQDLKTMEDSAVLKAYAAAQPALTTLLFTLEKAAARAAAERYGAAPAGGAAAEAHPSAAR